MKHSSSDNAIAAAYNQWAESYDTNENKTRDLAAHALRGSNLEIEGRDVIEIGCGTGRNTVWIGQYAASVTAVDFSEGMLQRARERLKDDARVRFVQHDITTRWPVADESTDVVIAMLVLEHVAQIRSVFEQAFRVMRSQGQLFICELHPMRQLLGGQAQFTKSLTGERQLVPAFLHHVSDYLNDSIRAGFVVDRMDEWRDDDALANSPPRLLALRFSKLKG
ncbi:MAG TPA: class I SAM-dependent methyltransferase [Pyrinomonadaceae bacterium]|nr:class I SAM-dependent methyltransferase [Pyrinomonadaceae bacterium]